MLQFNYVTTKKKRKKGKEKKEYMHVCSHVLYSAPQVSTIFSAVDDATV